MLLCTQQQNDVVINVSLHLLVLQLILDVYY